MVRQGSRRHDGIAVNMLPPPGRRTLVTESGPQAISRIQGVRAPAAR
jgi:hypothetical protein